jgi:hypothetical protein
MGLLRLLNYPSQELLQAKVCGGLQELLLRSRSAFNLENGIKGRSLASNSGLIQEKFYL